MKRKISDHLNPYSLPEHFHSLKGATVLIADYVALREDFALPATMSDNAIDEWILSTSAKISVPQCQSGITQGISHLGDKAIGFRPPLYTRAAIFPLSQEESSLYSIISANLNKMNNKNSDKYHVVELFLMKHFREQFFNKVKLNSPETGSGVDIKGVGHRSMPSHETHSSGIIHLADCLREYVFEKIVRQVLKHESFGRRFDTVKTYAVINGGFFHVDRNGIKKPCGLLMREIHDRPLLKEGAHVLTDDEALFLETSLRKFGISSSGGKRHSMEWDPVNLQVSLDNRLVDFGSYIFLKKPDRKLRLPSLTHPTLFKEVATEDLKNHIPSDEMITKNSIHLGQDTDVNDSFSDDLFRTCEQIANDPRNVREKLEPYLVFNV